MSLMGTCLPEISVVMPACDASSTIRESVASLQAQSFQRWELIIIDDGSRDGTGDIARELGVHDSRIQYVSQEHAGVSQARNRGISRATGEWLLFLDSDDTIKPEFFSEMLAAAREQAADLVVCGYGRILGPEGTLFESERGPISPDGCAELVAGAHFPIHAVIVRRELVVSVGGFDPALEACEDWDIWLKVAGQGTSFATVRKSLAIYRNSPRSLSKNCGKMMAGANKVLRRQALGAYGPAIARHKPAELEFARRRMWFYLWCGAIAAAQSKSPVCLPDPGGGLAAPGQAETWHVNALVEGLSLGSNVPVHQVLGIWPQFD